MTTLTEGMHTGEFIGECAMGIGYHVDNGTLISGQNLAAGTVVGKITASSKDTILAPGASDGSQTVSGIVYEACNATSGDKTAKFVRRGPMNANLTDLIWPGGISGPQKTAAIAQLLALGIKAS